MKKILSLILVLAAALGIALPAYAAAPWSDASSWALDELSRAKSEGLIPAPLSGKDFKKPATRAEFCALAVALYEKVKGEITKRTPFSDTKDENVEKAAAIGVVNGVGDKKFEPDASLTREQAAVMLARLASALGRPFEKKAPSFSDAGKISDWAKEGVGQAQAAGIMGGVGNNAFAPKDLYTREQSVITIIRVYRFVKSIYAMIDSGKYHIKIRIIGEAFDMTMEYYGKDGMFATVITDFGASIYKNGKVYTMIDGLKMASVTNWDSGIGDGSEFLPDESSLMYISEGTGEFLGKEYSCTEYEANGLRVFFYMDGDDFKGIREIQKNGGVTDTEILAFDQNVPGNVFEIPEGYEILEQEQEQEQE